uniref:Uncharacterized protein n=1 Tax=Vitrella brassicaformis TaxID=1169539 RepID=A0A7S1P9D6_9ALVE|mmetsp:Transcript_47733/g.119392  ORF Transcript_47733/g.119392 Transcript_47733/m.119392 type:complete len:256 (+) Transcript_47733:59-826(+)
MRWVPILLVALLAISLVPLRGEDDVDIADLDTAELEDVPEEQAKQEEEADQLEEAAADAMDASLSEPQRMERMKMCVDLVRGWVGRSQELLQRMVQEILSQPQTRNRLSEGEAINLIVHRHLTFCYFNINDQHIEMIKHKPPTMTPEQVDKEIIHHRDGTPFSLSKRQMAMLGRVIEADQANQSAGAGPAIGGWDMRMSSGVKILYIAIVVSVFFGAAIFALRKLMQEDKKEKKESSKSLRKKQKEERTKSKKLI